MCVIDTIWGNYAVRAVSSLRPHSVCLFLAGSDVARHDSAG